MTGLDDAHAGLNPLRCEVDGMLGSLVRWLRIIGIDAVFPRRLPSPDSIFVTRKRTGLSGTVVRISSEDVLSQLQEFLDATGFRPDPGMLFSRCLICNTPVRSVSPVEVKGRVPDGVLDLFSEFTECPTCRRVFWKGSHIERVTRKLEQMGVLWAKDENPRCGSSA